MTRRCFALFLDIVLLLPAVQVARAANETELKAEDIVAKHLESIGTSQARNAKSRVVQGVLQYRVLAGGSGRVEGKLVIASEGPKTHILLKVNADRYRGEQLISDGNKVSIAGGNTDKTKSEFADFLLGQDVPVKEGLLCGVLSTAWPLFDLKSRGGVLESNGLKDIDGHPAYALRYKPKRSSDLSIVFYFDKETFRHIRTVYTATRSAGLGGVTYNSPAGPQFSTGASEEETARRHEAHYRIEERFGDFKTADNLTLPTHYDLRFSEELQNGFTKSVEWDANASTVVNDETLDPRNFQIP